MSERNRGYISKDKLTERDRRSPSKDKGRKGAATPGTAKGRARSAERAGKTAGERKEERPPGGGGGKHKTGQRIWILLWMLLCGILLIRIWNLNHTMDTLRDRIRQLNQIAVRQQERLEALTETQGKDENQSLEGNRGADSRGGGQDGNDSDSRDNSRAGGESGSAGTDKAPEAAAVSGQGVAHKVYLTFDDGPGDTTEEILDILDRYNVKATFFVVGKEGEQAQEAMRKIVEAGHTLGMHSYTHKYDEIYASVENFAADFEKEQNYIYEVTGVKSMVYRFPGGSSNTVSQTDMRLFAEYLDSQGVRFFDWNISSGDGGSFLVPVETLIENCTATIKNHGTSVVLMHDVPGKTTTREALPKIIETIQAMDDTVLLPITEDTALIQHIDWQDEDTKKERMW